MRPVAYAAPTTVAEALSLVTGSGRAMFLGGGTNLVDLMREGIETPDVLVDVTGLPLAGGLGGVVVWLVARVALELA
jgi:xanthine dehydrogenase YagS FAD-binding subunit